MSELGAAIEAAVRANQRLRHVQSVVVAVADATVAECYFRGRRANDLDLLLVNRDLGARRDVAALLECSAAPADEVASHLEQRGSERRATSRDTP